MKNKKYNSETQKLSTQKNDAPLKRRMRTESESSKKQKILIEEEDSTPDEDGNYTVEIILAYNPINKLYLIKWKKYCWTAVTWEPYENVRKCTDFIKYIRERDATLEKLKKLDKFPNNKPFNFPTKQSEYINIFLCYDLELAIRNSNEELPHIYVINWVNDDGPPYFMYVNDILIKPKFMEDINMTNQVKGCADCRAEKTTDYCQEYKKYFKRNHIDFSVKEVKMSCSEKCICLRNPCPTRFVDNGRRYKLIIAKTLNKGWGLFAGEDIQRGDYICEYSGELITRNQAIARNSDYIFDMDYMYGHENDHSGNAKFSIDAYKYGNESRFANHSCNPNCCAISIYSTFKCEDFHRIGFFAKEDIKFGDEITIDYFGEEVANSNDKFVMIPCNCGTDKCRKTIPLMNNSKKEKINKDRDEISENFRLDINKLSLIECTPNDVKFVPEKFYRPMGHTKIKRSGSTPIKERSTPGQGNKNNDKINFKDIVPQENILKMLKK
uniref:Histone-lysine N-methyltransferase n=1 Tax=Parastrongyloides trichosuri TaxID=131310 RepID=A0A0N4ZMA3_PARTI